MYGYATIPTYGQDNKLHVYAASNAGPGTNGSGEGCPSGWHPGAINFYGYALTSQKFTTFRILDAAVGAQAQIFWAGSWRNLLQAGGNNHDFHCRSGTTPTCNIEIGLEVYKSSSGTWMTQNAVSGKGIEFATNRWLDGSLGGHDWTTTHTATEWSTCNSTSHPYAYDGITAYTDFRTPKNC